MVKIALILVGCMVVTGCVNKQQTLVERYQVKQLRPYGYQLCKGIKYTKLEEICKD